MMQKLSSRVTVVLFLILATAAMLGNCRIFPAVFDSFGNRVCAVGQPDMVSLSTSYCLATFECARLCDANPRCVVFNLYDNFTCEIFTCPSKSFRWFRNVESCKSFRVIDCASRCYQPECGFLPRDCMDVKASGQNQSGAYLMNPGNSSITTSVYCNMTSAKPWLVFQRRKDGSVNFERNWTDYAKGFGDPNGEFWLGNEALYQLTSTKQYKLRIDLEDFEGQKRYAEYTSFSINSSADYYRLRFSGYSGNAGDSLDYQNGQQFTTTDADHDKVSDVNCAKRHGGGWWFNACLKAHLNGRYLRGSYTSLADGINWKDFRGQEYSLKDTEMKMMPVN